MGSKKYIFKMHFTPMESYRELKVEAHNDQEAKELAEKKFLSDPYVYLLEDVNNKRIHRTTFEIEGGNSYEPKREDPPGHKQIAKVGSGQ